MAIWFRRAVDNTVDGIRGRAFKNILSIFPGINNAKRRNNVIDRLAEIEDPAVLGDLAEARSDEEVQAILGAYYDYLDGYTNSYQWDGAEDHDTVFFWYH